VGSKILEEKKNEPLEKRGRERTKEGGEKVVRVR
jgi:hypothetical protein